MPRTKKERKGMPDWLNWTYGGEILYRAFGEQEMEEIHAKYLDARINKSTREPTEQQYSIASFAQENGIAVAAKQFGVSVPQVRYTIGRVATYEFMKEDE